MDDPRLFETMFSMRSMRRLAPDPVPEHLIRQVLEAGTQAPNGQNTQPWAFLVIRDEEDKRFFAERYQRVMHERIRSGPPPREDTSQRARNGRAAWYLAHHLHAVPVLLLVCGKRDWPFVVPDDERVGLAPPSYGSVYPCVQNILLACRALGLGATLTTLHQLFEDELHAHFDIPADYGVVASIPIGYPLGRFGTVTRRPVHEVAYDGRWGRSFAEPAQE